VFSLLPIDVDGSAVFRYHSFMKHAVIINAMTDYSPHGSIDHRESLLLKATHLAQKKDIYLIATASLFRSLGNVARGFGRITVQNNAAAHVLGEMLKTLKGYDEFLYFYIDTPLLDLDIAREMLTLHRKEIVEYTYGDGFPVGVVPEVLNVELLPKLISLLGEDTATLKRDSVFTILQKQINSFDIETYFSQRDLTLRRIELTLGPERNRVVTERVIEKAGVECSFERFCALVDEEPLILRSLPAYVEVEITNRINRPCLYAPNDLLKRKQGDMGFEEFEDILEEIMSFTDDLHLSLSYLGEPLLHPSFRPLVERVVSRKGVKLIIESDGFLFTPEYSDWAAELQCDRLHFIFEVDAVDQETYRSIRGGDLRRVERNIRYLLSKQIGRVYVQMVRMDCNEGEMLQFYDQWQEEGAQVIIQKYNSFLDLLPPQSSSDLRPLDRQPCWHLQRDLVVFHDGSVPRCKQDINAEFLLGTLRKDEIRTIWEGNAQTYLEHCSGTYDCHCTICDEYYTFNF
jgi:spiro-SPASM protein